jgi:hypothetical protein
MVRGDEVSAPGSDTNSNLHLRNDIDNRLSIGFTQAPRWVVFFAACRSPAFMIVSGRMVV